MNSKLNMLYFLSGIIIGGYINQKQNKKLIKEEINKSVQDQFKIKESQKDQIELKEYLENINKYLNSTCISKVDLYPPDILGRIRNDLIY